MLHNPFFQSGEKDRPLNGVQSLLLRYADDFDMTVEVLQSWKPSHTGFCAAHGEAVMYLINSKGRNGPAAIREMDNLTANEAALLLEFFTHGVNRNYILKNRMHFQFEHGIFQQTLSYLINKQKLTFQQAEDALKGLCPGQIYMLRDCYRHGLRTEHFARVSLQTVYTVYAALSMKEDSLACTDALRYFRKIFILSNKKYKTPGALWLASVELMKVHENALDMDAEDILHRPCGQITSRRIRFLLRSAYSGIRADDFPAVFNSEQNKTYYSLLLRHTLHKPEALQEMKDLTEDKMIFLRRYFSHGVNYKRLRHFPHHMDCVLAYMKRTQCGAVEALDMLAPLSNGAMQYLHYLGIYGVTINDVKLLPPETVFDSVKVDKIIDLIITKHVPPGEALSLVVVEANHEDMVAEEPALRLSK